MKALLMLLLFLVLISSASCSSNAVHGASETSANEMIVALEQHGIPADKIRDPDAENSWIVTVPSQSRVQALRVLGSLGLPRPKISGFGQVYPSSGLIPTANEEQALLQYATSQELRKSLLTIDGVVDAHINLVLPKKPRVRLPGTTIPEPRASVVVKHKPSQEKTPAISKKQITSLLVGGVPGLKAENISVLLTKASQSQQPLQKPQLEQIGPIAVSPNSKLTLQALIASLCLVIIALGATLAFVLIRNGRSS